MLAAIERFFRERLQGETGTGTAGDDGRAFDALPLACAALMFEVVRADQDVDASERTRLRELLHDAFELPEEDLDALEALAEQEVEEATDLFQFTRLITANFGVEERIVLVERLWLMALADDEVDAFEEHTIRRIAGLIHVRDSDFIAAKLRARELHGG